MKGSSETKVFLSYSWTSESHKKWVRDLANRLMSDGVFVILDLWDLKPGQDKNTFMEKMVLDLTVQKVLVVCDKQYAEKANARRGGVGAESQLISQEVFEKTGQEKFIPIVVETDEKGKPYVPKFLESRFYFDLSKEGTFEEEYQNLLRNLFGQPLHKRPPLGRPPADIVEPERNLPLSADVTRKSIISPRSTEARSYIVSFFNQFIADLDTYHFEASEDEDYDETMVKLIDKMQPLRDIFVGVIEQLTTVDLSPQDLDLIHDYLERFIRFANQRIGFTGSNKDTDFDNYKFFLYEIVLYMMTVLKGAGLFKEMSYLLHTTYFRAIGHGETLAENISVFNEYVRTLDDIRNRRLQLNRVSVTADLVKARNVNSGIVFEDLAETDILIHLVTLLTAQNVWFPRLSAFGYFGRGFGFFNKFVSERFFERAKVLFSVENADDLKSLINVKKEDIDSYYRGVSRISYSIPLIEGTIDFDKIGAMP